jgi:NAD(P)-dependent dehydrogenase (short-subunit alcohol dehydrogenase family)
MRMYGTSKQANILFAAEAARRWPDLVSVSFHPGLVRTRFFADNRLVSLGMRIAPFLRTAERGADTLVWLTTAVPSDLVNGGYYMDRRLRRPAASANDPQLAARLWTASCKAVGLAE